MKTQIPDLPFLHLKKFGAFKFSKNFYVLCKEPPCFYNILYNAVTKILQELPKKNVKLKEYTLISQGIFSIYNVKILVADMAKRSKKMIQTHFLTLTKPLTQRFHRYFHV